MLEAATPVTVPRRSLMGVKLAIISSGWSGPLAMETMSVQNGDFRLFTFGYQGVVGRIVMGVVALDEPGSTHFSRPYRSACSSRIALSSGRIP